jgi:hypothetical protein
MLRRTLFLFLALSLPALAQEDADEDATSPEAGRRIIYQSETHLDMEGADVNAPHQGPEISLLPERVRARFNPMIKLRADFDDAMDSSVDEVR